MVTTTQLGVNQVQDIKVKSLVMEVLALDHMPTSQIRRNEEFLRDAFHVESGMLVEDPAGICGPIQTDLKYVEFGGRLRAAARAASLAVAAQASNKEDAAVSYWGEVSGDDFPKPPKSISGPAAVAAVPRPVKDTPQG